MSNESDDEISYRVSIHDEIFTVSAFIINRPYVDLT